jgi:CRP/FNR family transcriptional regulator, cyclic AMP receptor protein
VSAIGRALRVHAGERALVVPMVALTFVGMAGLVAAQSAANALFFDQVGTDALPLMYLAQGATAFVLMMSLAAVLGRVDRRRAYLAIPAGLALLALLERAVLFSDATWIYWVLWLTVAFALLLQNVFVWGVAGVVTDTRTAKRLFPLFAAGEILGSVAGGLLTAPLVSLLGTRNLVVVWAGALVAALILCRIVLSAARPGTHTEHVARARRARRTSSSPWRDLRAAFAYVRTSKLLVWMTAAAVLFSVLFFSLYLPWAVAATERYPDAGDLASFFGLFWAAMTGAAFLVSVLATNRLFAAFGIATMMMVLPLMYLGTFGILLASSAFLTLVVLRFLDGVWLQGVASPAWETLTNVVPDARRDQVRAFLNGGPAQAGTVIAGVIALVGQQILSARQFAAIGLATAALATFVVWRVRRSYASALVDALHEGRPHVFPDVAVARVPFAFGHDAQALAGALRSAEDEAPQVRRLAVRLLVDFDDQRARAALEGALGDPDAGVRAQAVVALAGRLDGPERDRVLRPLVDDPAAGVAAPAAAAVSSGPEGAAALARLRTLARDDDPAVRATAVSNLAGAPADAAPIATGALDDEDPGVRAAAITSFARIDRSNALGPAVALLEDPSQRVRDAAAAAVATIGDDAIDDLLGALDEPEARGAALWALSRLDIGERAIGVRAFADHCAAEARRSGELAFSIPTGDGASALLRRAVLEHARTNARTALRAISLVSTNGPDVRSAIDSLDAADPGQAANALETLENTVDAALVRPLLPLWETGDGVRRTNGNEWLQRALHNEDALVVACARFVERARQEADQMSAIADAMPVMERVLFLQNVPLFEELALADLLTIAEVAQDQTFSDGELLGIEGEIGEDLHIVVSGTVRVEAAGAEIARRGRGDVVGELSLITRHPRIASIVADGDVRAIRIGRREFESMIHDRPNIAIGVIQVLAHRLGEVEAAADAAVVES